MFLSRLFIGLLAWLLFVQMAVSVRADMILNTVGNIEWNPALQPAGPARSAFPFRPMPMYLTITC